MPSGRSKRHAYYHCISKCGYRIKEEIISHRFIQALGILQLPKRYALTYSEIMKDLYREEYHALSVNKAKALKGIEKFTERIAKAKNLLLDNYIDFDNYQSIKIDCETKIRMIGETVSEYTRNQVQISTGIKTSGSQLSELDGFFSKLNEKNKRNFLTHILIRSCNWEGGIMSVFQKPFLMIYGMHPVDEVSDNNFVETKVKSLLRNLALLQRSLWFESSPAAFENLNNSVLTI